MDGCRAKGEHTPEGRIAAAARAISRGAQSKRGREADYADFRDGLRPFVALELIRARIAEARSFGSSTLYERMKALTFEFEEAKKNLPDLSSLGA